MLRRARRRDATCSHSSAAEHSAYIRTVLGSNPSGSTNSLGKALLKLE